MALTGLEIYKLLPQTNCGDCGVPTCLAFAMKVASKQSSLEECPHVSDEAKETLGAASQPPQKLVKIGPKDNQLEIGNETVMFRHEEKFFHQPGIAVLVKDSEDVAAKAEKIEKMQFEHMGQPIIVDMVAVSCESGDGDTLKEAASKVSDSLGYPMVLIADEAGQLESAANALEDDKPLLWEKGGPSDELIELAADAGLPIVVEGDLETCDELAQKAKDAGIEEMVLCPGEISPAKGLEFLTVSRRAALRKSHRPLGFPVLMRPSAEDPAQQSLEAVHYVLKYAGIVVTDLDSPEYLLPVVTARQSVYIDPQVPVQVEAKLHEVNEPDENAPLLVTTNFALTFYSVLSEVESSHVPSRILAVDTEGTSVLTAWAAGDFGAEQVADALTKSGAFDVVADSYQSPVIPGLVAVISGELEEEIGKSVIVGPREASGIPPFLNHEWPDMVG